MRTIWKYAIPVEDRFELKLRVALLPTHQVATREAGEVHGGGAAHGSREASPHGLGLPNLPERIRARGNAV